MKTKAKKTLTAAQRKTRKLAPVKITRAYDASARIQKSLLVQTKIMETFVALLAERRGNDVNIDEIAKRSGISERTIYRLFNDKATLSAATDQYMQSYLLATGEQITKRDVPEFVTYLFTQFARNENLVLAYLYSRFGIAARASFRQKFNDLIIAKILQDKKMTLTKEREIKLAVIVSLINARIWHDLRSDFHFNSEEIGAGVASAIATLIGQL